MASILRRHGSRLCHQQHDCTRFAARHPLLALQFAVRRSTEHAKVATGGTHASMSHLTRTHTCGWATYWGKTSMFLRMRENISAISRLMQQNTCELFLCKHFILRSIVKLPWAKTVFALRSVCVDSQHGPRQIGNAICHATPLDQSLLVRMQFSTDAREITVRARLRRRRRRLLSSRT